MCMTSAGTAKPSQSILVALMRWSAISQVRSLGLRTNIEDIDLVKLLLCTSIGRFGTNQKSPS
jgi:hypothetical protein